MAVIHFIVPELFKEGRVYWLRSPLFVVDNGGEKQYYFTDEEMNKVRGKIKGVVTRMKG